MKLNTKIRYGLRTMIELGLSKNHEGLHQKDIAKNQVLSEKYLDPIIASLKVSGLIVNIAGKKSGYILKRPSSEIKIIDIYRTFEAGPYIIHCINDPKTCKKTGICEAKEYWKGMNNLITEYLSSSTLEMLVKQTEKNIKKTEKKSKAQKKAKAK
ncbi:MAG: Rrf2 family transcriptional regulator [Bacteroidota bacterium]